MSDWCKSGLGNLITQKVIKKGWIDNHNEPLIGQHSVVNNDLVKKWRRKLKRTQFTITSFEMNFNNFWILFSLILNLTASVITSCGPKITIDMQTTKSFDNTWHLTGVREKKGFLTKSWLVIEIGFTILSQKPNNSNEVKALDPPKSKNLKQQTMV